MCLITDSINTLTNYLYLAATQRVKSGQIFDKMKKNSPIPAKKAALIVVSAALFSLTACQNSVDVRSSGGPNSQQARDTLKKGASFSQFPDIPIPQGAKIDVEKTLVFGISPWFGQLSISSPGSVDVVFDFFQQGLPNYKWESITSIRSQTSILTYSQEGRILTVAIQAASISGSDVAITVAPRGVAASPKPQQQPAVPAQGSLKPSDL